MLLGVWGALEKISCFLGAAGRGVNRKSKSIGTAARVRSAIKRLQRKTSCRSSRRCCSVANLLLNAGQGCAINTLEKLRSGLDPPPLHIRTG